MAELIREGYLRELESFTDRPDLIKIITGVRRSGKSTILSQFRSRLESRGERVVYMDMERLGFSVTSDREIKLRRAFGFSDREVEIALMLFEGFNNRQIASALDLSEGTSRNYISAIYMKLGCDNRNDAIRKMKDTLSV